MNRSITLLYVSVVYMFVDTSGLAWHMCSAPKWESNSPVILINHCCMTVDYVLVDMTKAYLSLAQGHKCCASCENRTHYSIDYMRCWPLGIELFALLQTHMYLCKCVFVIELLCMFSVFVYVPPSTYSLMCRIFAKSPGDRVSIPGRVIPKTKKWYLMPPCLSLSIIR